jgi:large subunit ribosomal protein L15
MRTGKLRGNTSADAMPIGPFRTYNQPVNVAALDERFDAGADVTLEALKAAGLIAKLSVDVKILGEGELTKKLSVTAHSFSKSAVEKIEAAGGSVTRLREPVERKRKKHKAAAPVADEPEANDEPEVEAEAPEPEAAEVTEE